MFLGAGNAMIGPASSALGEHVLHVVGAGSEEEMAGVHARGCVAAMENRQAVRNGSDVHFVRQAVRCDDASLGASDAQLAVAAKPSGSGPQPAGICFGDALPEALFNGGPWASNRTKGLPALLLRAVWNAQTKALGVTSASIEGAPLARAVPQRTQGFAAPALLVVRRAKAEFLGNSWAPRKRALNGSPRLHCNQAYLRKSSTQRPLRGPRVPWSW